MKILVNKNNPAIKIITDALLSDGDSYITSFCSVPKYNWTLVEEEPTCKTCGFYENNCPFIRGKFIVYPSRVCKDYTYSNEIGKK